MTTEHKARRLYDESLVIDGLNVSNWDSPKIYLVTNPTVSGNPMRDTMTKPIEQQIHDIEISKMKPIQEEITQLLNDAEGMQNTDSGNEIEVKTLLSNQDNLLNQIKEIEETKIPALRGQIDTLKEERSTKL